MARRNEDSLAAILLTTRLVDSAAPPLNASDFWVLQATVPEPGRLLGADTDTFASLVAGTMIDADRIRVLLDRATAVALELERLESSGIRAVTVFDDGYPRRLVKRLGTRAPATLHVVGETSLMTTALLGVVGSSDVGPEGGAVAQDAARAAVDHDWGVVSGAARGVDRLAMAAAAEAGGHAVGLLADSLVQVVQEPELRRLIGAGRLCLATPYAPAVRFTPANATGRNKLIYALAHRTLVVASDLDTGATWAGATEALGKTFQLPVDVWTGPGAGPGNMALAGRGARPVTTVDAIFDESDLPPVVDDDTEQLHLGV